MKNIITFIIPVKHPENSASWDHVIQKLRETVLSISNQDRDGWKAVIVANDGADLPDFPGGFEVKRVDFAPNQIHGQDNVDKEVLYESIRIDKGRRVLAGMLHAGQMGYVMTVDEDDLISRRITSFVAANQGANGWYVREGYIWDDDGLLMYRYSDFSRFCGTSHIIRSDLYKLPESFADADDQYIRRTLGSHIFIEEDLKASGTPLEPLPFMGAVYRIGHREAYTYSGGIIKKFFKHRFLLKDPLELCRRTSRLRIKTQKIKKEFFG